MKKIRILSDCVLLSSIIIMLVLYAALTVWIAFFALNEKTVSDISEIVPLRIGICFLFVLMLIAVVASSPRFLCVIALSKTAIAVWLPFHRKKIFTYKQFRNVYCGGYFHGNVFGLGHNVWYIVLSQRKLSTSELNQINQLPNSEDVIKIRYTPKVCKRLRYILPDGHVRQLDSVVARIKN